MAKGKRGEVKMERNHHDVLEDVHRLVGLLDEAKWIIGGGQSWL